MDGALPRTVSEERLQLEQAIAMSQEVTQPLDDVSVFDVESLAAAEDKENSPAAADNPLCGAAVAADAALDAALLSLKAVCPTEDDFQSLVAYLTRRVQLLRAHASEPVCPSHASSNCWVC